MESYIKEAESLRIRNERATDYSAKCAQIRRLQKKDNAFATMMLGSTIASLLWLCTVGYIVMSAV